MFQSSFSIVQLEHYICDTLFWLVVFQLWVVLVLKRFMTARTFFIMGICGLIGGICGITKSICWFNVGICVLTVGSLWGYVGSLRVFVDSLLVLICSLWVCVGSLWVFVGSLWYSLVYCGYFVFIVGICGFTVVLLGSLWAFLCSLWVFVDTLWYCWVHCGYLCVHCGYWCVYCRYLWEIPLSHHLLCHIGLSLWCIVIILLIWHVIALLDIFLSNFTVTKLWNFLLKLRFSSLRYCWSKPIWLSCISPWVFMFPMTYKIIWLQIFQPLAYVMKIIPEIGRVHLILYRCTLMLTFLYFPIFWKYCTCPGKSSKF